MGIFNNILESFFSGFSGIGQQQQDRRQSESTKGEDIRLDLKLEFREAVFGCEKQIKIVRQVAQVAVDGRRQGAVAL